MRRPDGRRKPTFTSYLSVVPSAAASNLASENNESEISIVISIRVPLLILKHG